MSRAARQQQAGSLELRSGEEKEKIAASTCQREVVRQLKVKFIVLDLKSHKKIFL